MKKKLLLFLVCAGCLGYPQNFQYQQLPDHLLQKTTVTDSEIAAIKKQYFSAARQLSTYLPRDADRSGNTDYTALLQKGIDENTDIIFPDFPVAVSAVGLRLKSNTKILFLKNSKIKVLPNDKEFYAAISIENVKNVKLYFPVLEGERFQHRSTTGEWGMGIYIIHSENILIEKPHITNFWGDGIYFGKAEGITSKNILINGAWIDRCRRNGISIIAGDQIQIKNSVISNTHGTIPEYGIDIEPNKSDDHLNRIVLSDNITFNNKKGGLLFALDNAQGKDAQPVYITVNNHTDYYSEKGVEFFVDRGYQKYLQPLQGNITINGANLLYNKMPLINNESALSNIQLQLFNIKKNNIKVETSKMNNFVKKFREGKKELVP